MNYENILLETKNNVATVTINRPDKANAINSSTLIDLMTVFSQIKLDETVRAVILTGKGDKFFVAGADINEIVNLNPQEGNVFAKNGQNILDLIENLGKPVICAVNGFALGGGCEISLACTIRIASTNARFGLPETGLGVIPGFGGTQRLPRIVGKGRALEIMLTGDMVNAEEAYRIGLANKVVEQDELINTVEKIASKMIANAPIALKYCMDAVNKGLEMNLKDGLDYEASLFSLACSTDDMKIGMKAFIEKNNKPNFTGK